MASTVICDWQFCDSILVGRAIGGAAHIDSKVSDANLSARWWIGG